MEIHKIPLTATPIDSPPIHNNSFTSQGLRPKKKNNIIRSKLAFSNGIACKSSTSNLFSQTQPVPIKNPILKPTKSSDSPGQNLSKLFSNNKKSMDDKEMNMKQININFEDRLQYEKIFESFLLSTQKDDSDLSEQVEDVLCQQLSAKNVIFWQDIPSLHVLYSTRLKKVAKHSDGLIGFTFYERTRKVFLIPEDHPAYKEEFDKSPSDCVCTTMIIPLWDNLHNLNGVVQIMRPRSNQFNNEKEFEFIEYFTEKFEIYYQVLSRVKHPNSAIIEMMHFMEVDQFLQLFQKKMASMFNCRVAEIWRYEQQSKKLFCYKKTKVQFKLSESGIAGECIEKRYPVNCVSNRMLSSYHPHSDGSEIEPVFALPYVDNKAHHVFSIILRGGTNLQAFNTKDEILLRNITPYIIHILNNLEEISNLDTSKHKIEHQVINSLNGMVQLFEKRPTVNEFIKYALEKMEIIYKADRSSLFTYDHKSALLVSQYASGVKDVITISNNRAIASRCFSSGEVINVKDAYEDLDFDSVVDLTTGYRTKSVLALPVRNTKAETIGVIEFLNKLDGNSFEHDDMTLIISTFCGMMLENEQLKKDVFEATKELRTNLSDSFQKATDHCVQIILHDILGQLIKILNCRSGAIYIKNDEQKLLLSLINEGEDLQPTLPLDRGVAALTTKTKEVVLSNNVQHDPRVVRDPLDLTGIVINSMIIVPITKNDGACIGIVEIANIINGQFTNDQVAIVRSIAVLVSVILDKRDINKIAAAGNANYELNRYLPDEEKIEIAIPKSLEIIQSKFADLQTIAFNYEPYHEIEEIKLIFHIFYQTSILSSFNITAATLFNFLYNIREYYHNLPFHNWHRISDVIQYAFVQMKPLKLRPDERFAVMLTILSSGAHNNHIQNRTLTAIHGKKFIVGSNTELSFVHMENLIRIMASPDCNLFKKLDNDTMNELWELINQLLILTDPEQHFRLMNSIQSIGETFSMDEKEHRIFAMAMLVKSALWCYCFRPVELTNNVFNQLNQEFELDVLPPPDGDSLANIREHEENDKAEQKLRQFVGFQYLVILPFVKVFQSMFPDMELNTKNVDSHLMQWNDKLSEINYENAQMQIENLMQNKET